MSFIRLFSELSKNDVHLAGGKGASLGEMTQAGIPVPPGFVILAPAFDRFLHETGLKTEIEANLHLCGCRLIAGPKLGYSRCYEDNSRNEKDYQYHVRWLIAMINRGKTR